MCCVVPHTLPRILPPHILSHILSLCHTRRFSYVLMEMEPLVSRQGTLDEHDGDDEESGL